MPSCPRCGSPASDGDTFCRSCGSPVEADLPSAPQPAPHPPSPATAPPPGSARMALSPGKILVAAGIVIFVAAAAFFALSGFPVLPGAQNSSGTTGYGIMPVGGQCSGGLTHCSGKCVDLMTDAENCGACGFSVPFMDSCIDGQFSSAIRNTVSTTPAVPATAPAAPSASPASCPSGQNLCSGTCRDLSRDGANCGSCGNGCPSGQACLNSRCSLPPTTATAPATTALALVTPELSCSRGEIPCSGSCVNVFSDRNNCGVCGRACKSQEICVDARCGPACTGDETLCGDTCTDTYTDTDNCGGCGTECPSLVTNARGSFCSQGKCIIDQCKTGYADCDGKIANGCETNLLIDANNCGKCGTKCESGLVCYNRICSTPVSL